MAANELVTQYRHSSLSPTYPLTLIKQTLKELRLPYSWLSILPLVVGSNIPHVCLVAPLHCLRHAVPESRLSRVDTRQGGRQLRRRRLVGRRRVRLGQPVAMWFNSVDVWIPAILFSIKNINSNRKRFTNSS